MLDFGALPPEITSAKIYAGPGSASMTAAASAWSGLAAELNSAALGYENVVTQLASEEWMGPASASMAAAAEPYVAWTSATAALAEQASVQARAAAAAYETVLGSVIPPPMIAINRTELAQATQMNLFGQNNGVIAQLEAQYAQFWAQNTAAMYSYAGQAAAANNVNTFTSAPSIVNPGGLASQAAAATQTQASSAASIQQTLQNLQQNLQNAINLLQSPAGTNSFFTQLGSANPWLTEFWFLLSGQTVLPSNIGTFLTGYNNFASFFYNTEGLPYFSVGMGNFGVQIAKTAGVLGGAAPAAAAAIPKPPGIGGALGAGAGAGSQVAAGLGTGAHVGHLAVPASFPGASTAPPLVRPAVQAISEPITSGEGGAGNVLGGMPVGAGGAGRGAGMGPRYGFKPTVMPRPVVAG
jgi:PPE-repeat protein